MNNNTALQTTENRNLVCNLPNLKQAEEILLDAELELIAEEETARDVALDTELELIAEEEEARDIALDAELELCFMAM